MRGEAEQYILLLMSRGLLEKKKKTAAEALLTLMLECIITLCFIHGFEATMV